MLMLDEKGREKLWRRLLEAIETYTESVDQGRVTPELNPENPRYRAAAQCWRMHCRERRTEVADDVPPRPCAIAGAR